MRPRRGLFAKLSLLALLTLAAHAVLATPECGPFEDTDRASHRTLTWEDFQGPMPPAERRERSGDTAVAQIQVSLRIDELGVTTEPTAGGRWVARAKAPCVRAYMLKRLSGRSPEAALPFQLAHEQRHFDLARIYALRLRARLASLEAEGPSASDAEEALQDVADREYRKLSLDHQRAQRRYDRQTQNGKRRTLEERYFAQLEAQLASSP